MHRVLIEGSNPNCCTTSVSGRICHSLQPTNYKNPTSLPEHLTYHGKERTDMNHNSGIHIWLCWYNPLSQLRQDWNCLHWGRPTTLHPGWRYTLPPRIIFLRLRFHPAQDTVDLILTGHYVHNSNVKEPTRLFVQELVALPMSCPSPQSLALLLPRNINRVGRRWNWPLLTVHLERCLQIILLVLATPTLRT